MSLIASCASAGVAFSLRASASSSMSIFSTQRFAALVS